jgi:acylpyruvate hydrolase
LVSASQNRSFIPKSKIADPTKVGLTLKVNGTIKQKGEAKDMIFDIPRIVEHVSSIFTLSVSPLLLRTRLCALLEVG